MSRRRKETLRKLSEEERDLLEQIARAHHELASHVARAKGLLAVADGKTYAQAAQASGWRSYQAISQLVARFNQESLSALARRPGGGPPRRYGTAEQERILAAARRAPDLDQDGTATWSLSTLQQALQREGKGLEQISIFTIWMTLRQAGWTWQKDRTWCETGTVKRQRKSGVVEVIDPDATPKKT